MMNGHRSMAAGLCGSGNLQAARAVGHVGGLRAAAVYSQHTPKCLTVLTKGIAMLVGMDSHQVSVHVSVH